MGKWTIYNRRDDGWDAEDDLTTDYAFDRMMALSNTRCMIVTKVGGGFRLDMTRLGPVRDLPYADTETVADFRPHIELERKERKFAEREIKEDMLRRGVTACAPAICLLPATWTIASERTCRAIALANPVRNQTVSRRGCFVVKGVPTVLKCFSTA